MQSGFRLPKFAMIFLPEIIPYVDDYLRIREIEDWPNAVNGLQIENSGRVTKIGAAVDVSTRVLNYAAKKQINFLIVHHGLFWPGLRPVTGTLGRQLKIALENEIALYSAHLPLDVHPKVGNNAQLAGLLGLKSTQPFLEEKGQLIGLKVRASLPREELARRPLRHRNFRCQSACCPFIQTIQHSVRIHQLPDGNVMRMSGARPIDSNMRRSAWNC